MKLNKVDKKIIKYAYPLHIKPGYTKKKSLLAYVERNEEKLTQSIDRLMALKYLEDVKVSTHNGECYKLTELGIETANQLTRSIFAIIIEKPLFSVFIAAIVY
ncbi:hypothetical protein IT412_00375 [Candidatus Peregrinibacteria bacterium]|nr:hypothetical protein [Candidatus Peregrinibacteria bacterium]